MSLLTAITDKARTSRRHIVLPEGDDVRVMQAAAALREDGIAEISLVGARDSLEALSASHGIDLAGVDIVDPADEERRERCAAVIHEARRHRNVSLEDARQMALDRLMLGTAMVRAGMVDGMVAGAAHPTAEVVRSALQLVGMNPGSRIVSSFFLMEHALPHQAIQGTALYADCAMVIEPDPEELASIAMDTADNARNLAGIEPRVALLSFSTAGSAEHGHIDRVRAAGALVAERRPDIAIMTEVQFDAAIIPEILQRKAPGIGVPAPRQRVRLSRPAVRQHRVQDRAENRGRPGHGAGAAGAQAAGKRPVEGLQRGGHLQSRCGHRGAIDCRGVRLTRVSSARFLTYTKLTLTLTLTLIPLPSFFCRRQERQPPGPAMFPVRIQVE